LYAQRLQNIAADQVIVIYIFFAEVVIHLTGKPLDVRRFLLKFNEPFVIGERAIVLNIGCHGIFNYSSATGSGRFGDGLFCFFYSHVLAEGDLVAKSPAEGGLPPYRLDDLVGTRLRRALREDEVVLTTNVATVDALAEASSTAT